MRTCDPRSFCKLGKLAARPGRRVAVDRRRATHGIVANGCATARGQSIGIGCIIAEALLGDHRTERTGGVCISLYSNNIADIIIFEYNGFVKSLVILSGQLTVRIVSITSENVSAAVLFLGDPSHRIILVLCCTAYAVNNPTDSGLIIGKRFGKSFTAYGIIFTCHTLVIVITVHGFSLFCTVYLVRIIFYSIICNGISCGRIIYNLARDVLSGSNIVIKGIFCQSTDVIVNKEFLSYCRSGRVTSNSASQLFVVITILRVFAGQTVCGFCKQCILTTHSLSAAIQYLSIVLVHGKVTLAATINKIKPIRIRIIRVFYNTINFS